MFQGTYKQFVIKNPHCTFEEFEKATGGSKPTWYTTRYLLRKQGKLVATFKPGAKKAKPKAVKEEVNDYYKRVAENFINDNPINADKTRTTLGITPDFIWYESALIRNEVNGVMAKNLARFEHLVRVMEERDREKNYMLQQLMTENKRLKEANGLTV